MTAICAFQPAGVDVKRTQQARALDASVGRSARLQRPPRERPEFCLKRALPRGTLRPLSRASYPSVSSERDPRIGEHGIVARRVVRATQIRAVEIRRAAEEVQVLCELQADPHIPGRIRKRRALAEREVGEILDKAAAVRTADETVIEGADTGGRAKNVVAGSVEIAVAGPGDIEIANAHAVGVIPDERGIGLEAIELVAKVRRYSLREGRVQSLPFHDIGEFQGQAVLIAGILDLRVEADVEKIVRPKAVYTAGGDP